MMPNWRYVYLTLLTIACLLLRCSLSLEQELDEDNRRVILSLTNQGTTSQQYYTSNFDTSAYRYGYDIGKTGNFHHETRGPDGVTYGCYGYIDEKHHLQATHYVADTHGYRTIKPDNSGKVYPSIGELYPDGVIRQWHEFYFPIGCGKLEGGVRPSIPTVIYKNDDNFTPGFSKTPSTSSIVHKTTRYGEGGLTHTGKNAFHHIEKASSTHTLATLRPGTKAEDNPYNPVEFGRVRGPSTTFDGDSHITDSIRHQPFSGDNAKRIGKLFVDTRGSLESHTLTGSVKQTSSPNAPQGPPITSKGIDRDFELVHVDQNDGRDGVELIDALITSYTPKPLKDTSDPSHVNSDDGGHYQAVSKTFSGKITATGRGNVASPHGGEQSGHRFIGGDFPSGQHFGGVNTGKEGKEPSGITIGFRHESGKISGTHGSPKDLTEVNIDHSAGPNHAADIGSTIIALGGDGIGHSFDSSVGSKTPSTGYLYRPTNERSSFGRFTEGKLKPGFGISTSHTGQRDHKNVGGHSERVTYEHTSTSRITEGSHDERPNEFGGDHSYGKTDITFGGATGTQDPSTHYTDDKVDFGRISTSSLHGGGSHDGTPRQFGHDGHKTGGAVTDSKTTTRGHLERVSTSTFSEGRPNQHFGIGTGTHVKQDGAHKTDVTSGTSSGYKQPERGDHSGRLTYDRTSTSTFSDHPSDGGSTEHSGFGGRTDGHDGDHSDYFTGSKTSSSGYPDKSGYGRVSTSKVSGSGGSNSDKFNQRGSVDISIGGRTDGHGGDNSDYFTGSKTPSSGYPDKSGYGRVSTSKVSGGSTSDKFNQRGSVDISSPSSSKYGGYGTRDEPHSKQSDYGSHTVQTYDNSFTSGKSGRPFDSHGIDVGTGSCGGGQLPAVDFSGIKKLPVYPRASGYEESYAPDKVPKGASVVFMPVIILPQSAYDNCSEDPKHAVSKYQEQFNPQSLFGGSSSSSKDQCTCPCPCGSDKTHKKRETADETLEYSLENGSKVETTKLLPAQSL